MPSVRARLRLTALGGALVLGAAAWLVPHGHSGSSSATTAESAAFRPAVATSAAAASAQRGGDTRSPAPTPSSAPTGPGSPVALAAPGLAAQVLAALADSTASVRAVRVDIDGLGPVLRSNDTLPLPPASTEKLFTGATALLTLGPSTRLPTRFALYGVRSASTFYGNLYLTGGGDPMLSSVRLDRVAATLASTGVRQIKGKIAVDASRYDVLRQPPGWKRGFMPSESGPLSALAVDGNTSSDAAIANPEIAAGVAFKRALAAHHVVVTGGVTKAKEPTTSGVPGWSTSIASAPVSSIVATALKNSVNFYAEELVKEIGLRAGGEGTTAAGVAAISDTAARLGVPLSGKVVDGSGLSSLDRQTAGDEVAFLEAVAASPVGQVFQNSLSIACKDGTLKKRNCGTPAAGRVFAKTGTLDHVRCLAGYTTTASGRKVTFAFQLSGVRLGYQAVAAMDKAVVLLASYAG